jgi:hypothetical protein
VKPAPTATWATVRDKRQAIRDAQTLPTRFSALCDYQGELAAFVDQHWAQLEAAFGRPMGQCAVDPSLALLASLEAQLRGLQRQLANAANEPVMEFEVRRPRRR